MIKVMLDEGARLPEKAYSTDGGFDLKSREMKIIPAGGSAVFDTGVHMQIPFGYAGLIVSKSGLNVKHNITSTGLVDCGYTGSIQVKLYNHGKTDYLVHEGDKISQIVLKAISSEHECVEVNSFDVTERGVGGFGSTGR